MSDVARLAYENTIIDLVPARPLQRLSAGLLVPANTRALMAAGLAGEVRLRAGREIEDELSRFRPLDLGAAYPTAPGRLVDAGVELLVHAVFSREPGEPHRPGQDERAVIAALAVFEEAGIRTLTLPIIQLADGRTGPDRQHRTVAAALTGHLRRRSRLRNITIAGLDGEMLRQLAHELQAAGAFLAADESPEK
jgi:O-acetyl-ADP-ribose deacetylase (regulator of RNase III)